MPDKKTYKILGAGPSGMAAAINLVKAGLDVTVYEQKDKPAARFSNGWQIIENYSSRHIDALDELIEMNISPDFYYKSATEIDFFDHRTRKFRLKGKQPFGYYIKRGYEEDCLDAVLHKTAANAGVQIHYSTRLDPKEADIISGGHKGSAGIAKEIVFDTSSEDILLTILDNNLSPKGFSYLFIINGRGTIGTAILTDFKNIDHYANQVLIRVKQLHRFDMVNIEESTNGVNFFVPSTGLNGQQIFTGEAAGFQDYLFGIGIRRSIQSGYLAAKSIIENTNYDELWKKHFGNQLESGILNRIFFEFIGNYGYTYALKTAEMFDFQKAGLFLQNPGVFRNTAKNVLIPIFRAKNKCSHGNRCKWCRN